MFGSFQESKIRIEVQAPATIIRESFYHTKQLKTWLWTQHFERNLPDRLSPDLTFSTWIGPVEIQHQVAIADEQGLRFILSKGIDGYHEWSWGDNWIQGRLAGISLLPLNLGQSVALNNIKNYVEKQARQDLKNQEAQGDD